MSREDFIRAYRQYLSSPQGQLKREYKFLRMIGHEPDDARRLAAARFEQQHGYTREQLEFLVAMEGVVAEECPADAPWLSADPDFVRQTIERQFEPGAIEPEALATAVSWIVDRAAR